MIVDVNHYNPFQKVTKSYIKKTFPVLSFRKRIYILHTFSYINIFMKEVTWDAKLYYTEKSKHRWSMSGRCWQISRWKLKTIHPSTIFGHRLSMSRALRRNVQGIWRLSIVLRCPEIKLAISTQFLITCDTLFITLLGTILRYFVH